MKMIMMLEKGENPASPRPVSKAVQGHSQPSPNLSPTNTTMLPDGLATASAHTLLALSNNRCLALLQARIDHHEVAIHSLRQKLEMQRIIVGRLVQICWDLKRRLRGSNATQARMGKAIRLAMLYAMMARIHTGKNTGLRDVLGGIRPSKIWAGRGAILKALAWCLLCHFGLSVGQVYRLQDTMVSILFAPLLGRSSLRQLRSVLHVSLLLGTAAAIKGSLSHIQSRPPWLFIAELLGKGVGSAP